MPVAELASARIDYLDQGCGPPVLLVHGFGSTKEVNWVNTGWVKRLLAQGFRVIAHDNRGHGGSEKFYQREDYSLATLAGDAVGLLDHLEIERCDLIGYSMGARICSLITMQTPARTRRLVIGGNGIAMIHGAGDWSAVVAGLLADKADAIIDPRAKAFRAFADQTGNDRKALAACLAGARHRFCDADFRAIAVPVLVAVGTADDIAGDGAALADLMQQGRHLPIPGRDHMKSVGDKVFVEGAINFLRTG